MIKKTEPILKREISNYQRKLVVLDTELKKQLSITQKFQNEYEQVSEVREHLREKADILCNTYTTLKKDIHTRK